MGFGFGIRVPRLGLRCGDMRWRGVRCWQTPLLVSRFHNCWFPCFYLVSRFVSQGVAWARRAHVPRCSLSVVGLGLLFNPFPCFLALLVLFVYFVCFGVPLFDLLIYSLIYL